MGFFNEFLSKNKNKNGQKEEKEKNEQIEGIENSDLNSSQDIQSEESLTDEQQPANREMIECYDEQGQKILVSREEIRKTILPNQLKNHWSNADALYNDILLAFKDDFNEEALDAAKHLVHIDEIKERGYTTLAIAYMTKELFGEAEKTLKEYINLFGKTGMILTNLAKVHHQRGDIEGAKDLVWESLCLEPNQEATLQWWVILNMEAGQNNVADLLKKITAIKGSWLPQLYLARYYIEQKDLESAKPIYEYVLNTSVDELPVLYIISGDLGNNGYINEIIDIVAPLYDPEKHDIMAGMNILHAYIQTGKHVEGQKLIDKLMKSERPDVKAVLQKLASDFETLEKAQKNNGSKPEGVEYELVVTDKPIWFYGLKSPEWLLPKELKSENIGFLAFADLTDKTGNVTAIQRDDNSARLTRGLPLLLQEILLFKHSRETKFLIPVEKDKGPYERIAEYGTQSLYDAARTNDLDLLVTGSISGNEDEYDVKVVLFEKESQSTQTFEMKLSNSEDNSEFMATLNSIIMKITETKDIELTEPEFYDIPKKEIIFNYLSALGLSLTQSLVDNKVVKLESLWGETNILNSYLDLALSAPENPVAKIILISGLSKSKSYGSEVYKEFQEQTVKLLADEQSGNSPIRLLVPFIYYLYDMKKEFIAAMDRNSKLN